MFNQEAMLPAHGDKGTGLVSIRILHYLRFVNSKVRCCRLNPTPSARLKALGLSA